eukprot:350657-Chlamydomonas_euryale.AAC.2
MWIAKKEGGATWQRADGQKVQKSSGENAHRAQRWDATTHHWRFPPCGNNQHAESTANIRRPTLLLHVHPPALDQPHSRMSVYAPRLLTQCMSHPCPPSLPPLAGSHACTSVYAPRLLTQCKSPARPTSPEPAALSCCRACLRATVCSPSRISSA